VFESPSTNEALCVSVYYVLTPRRQPPARQPRLPRVVLPVATSGWAKTPPADRRDPCRPQFGRRLRGRKALPPARSTGIRHGDQRSPMPHRPIPNRSRPRRHCPYSYTKLLVYISVYFWMSKPKSPPGVPFYWAPSRNQISSMIHIGDTASTPRRVPAVLSVRLHQPIAEVQRCAERASRRQNSRGGK
jgi:hypothetical protein